MSLDGTSDKRLAWDRLALLFLGCGIDKLAASADQIDQPDLFGRWCRRRQRLHGISEPQDGGCIDVVRFRPPAGSTGEVPYVTWIDPAERDGLNRQIAHQAPGRTAGCLTNDMGATGPTYSPDQCGNAAGVVWCAPYVGTPRKATSR